MNFVFKALLAAIIISFTTLSYTCPTCIGRLEDDVRPFFLQEHDTDTAVDALDRDDNNNEPQEQKPLAKQRGQS
jgi:hypothetical protein